MSAIESEKKLFQSELNEIFSHPFFQKFIPDYKAWNNEQIKLKPLLWIRSKKMLYAPLKLLFNFSRSFTVLLKRSEN